jgi:beta-phosphoglucomutase
MFEGIIFDLDGVIVFTDRFHYLAWKKLADNLGIPFNEKDNDRLRGVSRMESLNIILEKSEKVYSEEEKAVFADEKNQMYRNFLKTMKPSDVSTQTRKVLEELRSKGVLLAVGSSSKNATYIVEQVDIKKYFDTIVDGNEITHSKPNPEVFLKAADKLGLSPKKCAVVEDASAGIEAAKNGGFFAIGIGSALKTTDCDKKIDFLSDLLKFLPKNDL